MTDTKTLRAKIAYHGYRMEKLSKQMGMSENTLRSKLKGQIDFKIEEAQRLAALLYLTPQEQYQIFLGFRQPPEA